jgi:beta-lactam-binding protein with PASTA domain
LLKPQRGQPSLTIGMVTETESDAVAGTAIDQNPKPGTQVSPGAAVDPIIARAKSVGPGTPAPGNPRANRRIGVVVPDEHIKVPDVVGKLSREAINILSRAGLKYEFSGDGPHVRAQVPKAGEPAVRGSTVTLTLAPQRKSRAPTTFA